MTTERPLLRSSLRVALVLSSALGVFSLSSPSGAHAQAWDLFRSENDHVAEGNELMAAGDPTAALAEYDAAARELPSEGGVHVSRGLALLASGDSGGAREAFAMATDPPVPTELRAEAHYDIGVAFFGEAEAAATAEDHDAAQRLFREAADAFRSSLRLVPGNRDAGWNLELALRRILEEEERAEEEAENEESEEGDEGEEGEESSEGEEGEEGDESSECEEGEEGEESSEGEEGSSDEESPGEEGEEGGEEEGEEPASEGGDEGAEDAEDGTDGSEETESEDEEGDPRSSAGEDGEGATGEPEGDGSDLEAGGSTDRSLPPDMERVLDALEDGEENLSAARARGRADRERRRVEHDW